jgi:peptidoglycan/xylan/chitin deacetylase (PgdA/CDA1 family)
MYHSVSARPPGSTRRLSVHPDQFDAQLDLLRLQGFRTVTFGELGEALRTGAALPERTVVLTFDDGYADFQEHAVPALEERGMRATVFVTTGWLADAGPRAAGRPLDRMLTGSQLRQAAGAGMEIGAHSHSHPALDQVPAAALRQELETSRSLLESDIGGPVRSLAYPFGYSSPEVRQAAAAAGYRSAAAVGNTLIGGRPDLYALPRLTVRRSTSMRTFDRLARSEGIGRAYAADRTLTWGWAGVRRARSALRNREQWRG